MISLTDPPCSVPKWWKPTSQPTHLIPSPIHSKLCREWNNQTNLCLHSFNKCNQERYLVVKEFERMNAWKNEQTKEWTCQWTNKQTNGLTNGWINPWTRERPCTAKKLLLFYCFFFFIFLGGKSFPQPPTLRTQKVNHNYLKLCSSQVDKVGKSDSKSLFSHWRFRKWLIWMFKHQIFANAHPGTVYCKAYLQISNWKSQVKLYESWPHTLNESKRSFQKLLSGFFLLRGGGVSPPFR